MNRHVSDQRLLKLAAYLRTVPPKRFDYRHWVGRDWKGAPDLSCGTTACALGHAASMPAFRKLGLHLKRASSGETFVALRGLRRRGWAWYLDASIQAGAKIFGLAPEEARFLFLPDEPLYNRHAPGGGARPKTVAAHIERFVRERARAAA
jgi:hypothetical protein